MSAEQKAIPGEVEQQKLIAKFRASLVLSSDAQARGYLEFCDWDLEDALATRAADYRE